jgi:16S rRNA (adenine1518-N6/adenine1519-N6)-dimethyltransferase
VSVRPKKELGQHFLVDRNILGVIGRLAELDAGDVVLEVGPGLGVLTQSLAARVRHVHTIEVDRSLEPHLAELPPHVAVHWGDALALDLAALEPAPTKLVANLPYNVATPLVCDLLDGVAAIEKMLVMVQREVAERLCAEPRSDAYGAVSVKVAYWATARVAGLVPASVFRPRPNVESALAEIRRRDEPAVDVDPEPLFQLVRAAFTHRRKMLRRSLAGIVDAETFTRVGIDAQRRPEELGVVEWGQLTGAWLAQTGCTPS